MNHSQKSIQQVFLMILILFALLIGCVIKIVVIDSKRMISNPYNPRLSVVDNTIKRGDIKDINGIILAYSQKEGNSYQRYYVNGIYSAHILGYGAKSKAGIEATQNFTLQKVNHETLQRLGAFFKDDEIMGNSVVLTVDSYLQEIATNLLGSNRGAVVVMEVETGRIMAMVSKVNYDPQTVSEQWESLRQKDNSPLLNRATQGLYAPGSTFKIVTAVAAMRYLEDYEHFTYECSGSENFKDKVINCNNKKAHGAVGLTEAFAQSCNCYFATVAVAVGNEKLIQTAQDLGFNQDILFELNINPSTVLLQPNSTESELVETSIGQGKTTVTPLAMVQLVSAIANEGVPMEPYIVDHVEDYRGKTVASNVPQRKKPILTSTEAEMLKTMMVSVVNEGTGFQANSEYFQVAGKTGTAQNSLGSDHLWFVGFAPAENPQYAVAVVLENADGSMNAGVIARKMLYNSIHKEEK